MNATVEQLQRDLEICINQQAADLLVLQVTLQTVLCASLESDPKARQGLAMLKRRVLEALAQFSSGAEDAQGTERRKPLHLFRAEAFFQEIEETLGIAGTKPAPPSA